MSREYLAKPLSELGVDYDDNLAFIRAGLDVIAQAAVEAQDAQFESSSTRSCDNGGVLYDITCQRQGERFSVGIDLSDDLFIASLWDQERPGRCADLVFTRARSSVAKALRGVESRVDEN